MNKITLQAEVIDDHENAVIVRVDTGFGDPVLRISKDKILKIEEVA